MSFKSNLMAKSEKVIKTRDSMRTFFNDQSDLNGIFKYVATIGKGAYGQVYLAEDAFSGNVFAIK